MEAIQKAALAVATQAPRPDINIQTAALKLYLENLVSARDILNEQIRATRLAIAQAEREPAPEPTPEPDRTWDDPITESEKEILNAMAEGSKWYLPYKPEASHRERVDMIYNWLKTPSQDLAERLANIREATL